MFFTANDKILICRSVGRGTSVPCASGRTRGVTNVGVSEGAQSGTGADLSRANLSMRFETLFK